MRARTVNESQQSESFPIATVTWEDIEPRKGPYMKLPLDAGSSMVIDHSRDFRSWMQEFIGKYENEGELVHDKDWKVVGNPKFDRIMKASTKGYSSFYKEPGYRKGD